MEKKNRLTVYSVEETAQIMGVTVRTVYNYIKDGRLRAGKIGKYWRIQERDLQAMLDGAAQEHAKEIDND